MSVKLLWLSLFAVLALSFGLLVLHGLGIAGGVWHIYYTVYLVSAIGHTWYIFLTIPFRRLRQDSCEFPRDVP
jgi:hypothetical protein